MWLLAVFVLIGFLAQIVDGSIGMAYGVFSTSSLLALCLEPAVASASVHTAEVFTTLTSGLSHFKVGNVDKRLFKRLVLPGSLSACIGAYVLVNFPVETAKPIILLYLGIMGFVVLLRCFNVNLVMYKINRTGLAVLGGFMDAVGGGGWGPIVTSTLIADGENPSKAIGSANLAEFFVAACQTLTFTFLLGLQNLPVTVGLTVGGVAAAPIGAVLCKKIPRKGLMLSTGLLIMFLAVKGLMEL